tara:strand:- start:44 stop:367 length:324 start_codon:yes stop_codon:yes gene_type:complete
MRNMKKHYSILGGVVAPRNSAYMIKGMPNPLAEKPTKAIDRSLPSLRDNSGVSRFNDFNPYNQAPRKSPEIVRNTIAMRSKRGDMRYTVDVNTFQPMGSPMLNHNSI